jgi:hypothetical protein
MPPHAYSRKMRRINSSTKNIAASAAIPAGKP